MARNHKVKGPMRVIQWILGKKNSYGNNIYEQFGRWIANKHPDGTKKKDPDTSKVMDQFGNFTYEDNTTGLQRLWNDLTGKTGQMYETAVNNWTQQYNDPEHQKERLEQAGYNPNLVNASGLSEFTPQATQMAQSSVDALSSFGSGIFDLVQKASGSVSSVVGVVDKVMDITAKGLGMSKHKLDNAINEARLDPQNLSEQIRRMFKQDALNEHIMDNQENALTASDLGYRTEWILNSIANAVASDDLKNMTEPDPFSDNGGVRLTQQAKEKNRNKREAQNAQWIISVAEASKKTAEQTFYDEKGKYPDWSVDVFDEEFNQQMLGVLDKMPDGVAKTIVLGVISVIRSLSGSLSVGPKGVAKTIGF